jgi:hypothetical protein
MNRLNRSIWGALAAGLTWIAVGCGTPGAPQPPSLNLPEPVANLAAVRTGNQVSLTWTMPRRNTDKLLLKGNIPVRLCREEGHGTCLPAGELTLAAAARGTFTDQLPTALAAGSARPLTYFVELKNSRNRSAGLSNAAVVLAGAAPDPVAGLTAEPHKDGIVLRWSPEQLPERQAGTEGNAIRLRRKLVTAAPQAKSKPQSGPLAAPAEPLERNLLVESGSRGEVGRALDKEIHFGQTYEYRAQRILRIRAGEQVLELAGAFSAPIRIDARDTFPPAVPTGLAAIATEAEAGAAAQAGPRTEKGAAIDLSWQPDGDGNLAGYIVYRREGEEPWARISPSQPLPVPAFRDSHVLPGHTYRYAITAVSEGNYESARSIETEETVPVRE